MGKKDKKETKETKSLANLKQIVDLPAEKVTAARLDAIYSGMDDEIDGLEKKIAARPPTDKVAEKAARDKNQAEIDKNRPKFLTLVPKLVARIMEIRGMSEKDKEAVQLAGGNNPDEELKQLEAATNGHILLRNPIGDLRKTVAGAYVIGCADACPRTWRSVKELFESFANRGFMTMEKFERDGGKNPSNSFIVSKTAFFLVKEMFYRDARTNVDDLTGIRKTLADLLKTTEETERRSHGDQDNFLREQGKVSLLEIVENRMAGKACVNKVPEGEYERKDPETGEVEKKPLAGARVLLVESNGHFIWPLGATGWAEGQVGGMVRLGHEQVKITIDEALEEVFPYPKIRLPQEVFWACRTLHGLVSRALKVERERREFRESVCAEFSEYRAEETVSPWKFLTTKTIGKTAIAVFGEKDGNPSLAPWREHTKGGERDKLHFGVVLLLERTKSKKEGWKLSVKYPERLASLFDPEVYGKGKGIAEDEELNKLWPLGQMLEKARSFYEEKANEEADSEEEKAKMESDRKWIEEVVHRSDTTSSKVSDA